MDKKDLFRSPLFAIKRLLKTGAIPYLLCDYTKDTLVALVSRENKFYLCSAKEEDFATPLVAIPILEDKVDAYILEATKLDIDYNVIQYATMSGLLDALSNVSMAINATKGLACVKNKQFCDDDFRTLTKLGYEAKYDETYWSLDEED